MAADQHRQYVAFADVLTSFRALLVIRTERYLCCFQCGDHMLLHSSWISCMNSTPVDVVASVYRLNRKYALCNVEDSLLRGQHILAHEQRLRTHRQPQSLSCSLAAVSPAWPLALQCCLTRSPCQDVSAGSAP